jgi:DNA gyrase subunit A
MTTDTNVGRVRVVHIEEEMRASYLDYAMSVIVARALPDVRDGLKPVQRRILYAMSELALRPGSQYKKSARIVGEVLGKFHPHGDDPVYEAMVRMAQDFSLRYPVVDGQGNFGSVDNDPPAAMRYTEARLAAIAEEILADIDRDTVDFTPNFDGSLKEPVVLPSRLPNLLVNGASGIAVGMATNIPPHNLGEVCDAICLLIDNPEASSDDLSEIVRGPDFPTGGIIFGRQSIKSAHAEGRGRIIVRARARIEETTRGGRQQIVVSELPYQVNKAALVEKIADLVKQRRLEGVSDLRDESDRHGMRIVIELGRSGQAKPLLNFLYKHTAMQSTFAVNMLALVDGQPRTIRLKAALEHYINFRREVIRRRSQFDLEKAREREHILQGYMIALQNLDLVIQTIRRAQSAEQAKEHLMRAPFRLSDRQAQAVLDMQLRRLARLERQKIEEEFAEVIQRINYLEDLLANPRKIDFLIKEDTQELKKKYGDERRTRVVEQEVESFSEEDLIPHQEVVVALSNRGYIKRMPLETYRLQRRGGRGITGMLTREADAVRRLLVADTHDSLLFFTDRGRVFQLRTHEIPDTSRQARGIPLINLIDIDQGELVTAVVAARTMDRDFLVLATKKGEAKKTALSEFESVRRSGLIAMDLEAGDELVAARLAAEGDDVILITSDGHSVRFAVDELRSASRASGGVRGVRVGRGAHLVSMEVVKPGEQLLTVTANGYGKRTPVEEYPRHSRGGQGVITHEVTDKTGPVAIARMVNPMQELIVISAEGIVLRTRLDSIAQVGRASQGVQVMRMTPGDRVASIATIDMAAPTARQAPAAAPDKAAKKAPPSGRRPPPKPAAGRATAPAPPKRAPRAPSAPPGKRPAPERPATGRAGTPAPPKRTPRAPSAPAGKRPASSRPATSAGRASPSAKPPAAKGPASPSAKPPAPRARRRPRS